MPPEDRPPVANVFFAFRLMVGIGLLLIATGLVGASCSGGAAAVRDAMVSARRVSYMWPLGFIAILAGWLVTEQGRQPCLVYGLLRTADGISPVPGASVLGTLVLFVFVYGIVFATGVYYINRLIDAGTDRARRPKHPPACRTGRSRPPKRRPAKQRAEGRTTGRASRSQTGGKLTMEWYLPVIWAGLIGTAVAMYVRARRLRPRHRHPLPVHPEGSRPRRDDEFGRAVLGRQ